MGFSKYHLNIGVIELWRKFGFLYDAMTKSYWNVDSYNVALKALLIVKYCSVNSV